MIPALPGRSHMGHLTRRRLRIGRYRVMYDITMVLA
jgi:mRNA-degrading endonuclease RelE of RelBE toxin-antitoxin system